MNGRPKTTLKEFINFIDMYSDILCMVNDVKFILSDEYLNKSKNHADTQDVRYSFSGLVSLFRNPQNKYFLDYGIIEDFEPAIVCINNNYYTADEAERLGLAEYEPMFAMIVSLTNHEITSCVFKIHLSYNAGIMLINQHKFLNEIGYHLVVDGGFWSIYENNKKYCVIDARNNYQPMDVILDKCEWHHPDQFAFFLNNKKENNQYFGIFIDGSVIAEHDKYFGGYNGRAYETLKCFAWFSLAN